MAENREKWAKITSKGWGGRKKRLKKGQKLTKNALEKENKKA